MPLRLKIGVNVASDAPNHNYSVMQIDYSPENSFAAFCIYHLDVVCCVAHVLCNFCFVFGLFIFLPRHSSVHFLTFTKDCSPSPIHLTRFPFRFQPMELVTLCSMPLSQRHTCRTESSFTTDFCLFLLMVCIKFYSVSRTLSFSAHK